MLFLLMLLAQGPDPAYEPLSKAFEALRNRDYDSAITSFQQAAVLVPARADIRKNLAYALLKTGDSEAAREQFGQAMRIDAADLHVALEYAFLCFEARDDAPSRKAEARRIFLRVKEDSSGDNDVRATAAGAFQGIDEPLKTGIARWRQALVSSPPTFSAHYELGQLAEQRDELDLATAEYRAAFQMLPERKSVLLELARVEKAHGNPAGAIAALLAASRGGEPRAAELAKEQLPVRYPYVYEFRQALELDPTNVALHRELAYLLLIMSEKEPSLRVEAERELRRLGLSATPLLNTRESHDRAPDPRILGQRSYDEGFLKDALRYFTQAREANPADDSLALKLGWTNNLLHDDASAIHWFDIARHSSDTSISAEAGKAYKNLRQGLQRVRTTVWMYPLYSSRWSDVFGYGQAKTELRLKKFPVHPYLSVRFIGDVRRVSTDATPVSLSESAFILGAGVATQQWHGGLAWFEAGGAFSYIGGKRWNDYRGGISYSKTRGASMAAEHGGMFLETIADSIYVSHFSNDLINYSQNKFGYMASLGGLKTQTFWTANMTVDVKRQYWANFVETGPGFRVHPPGLPSSVSVTLSAIRGVYLVNEGNPRRPNFNEVRVGVWYAFTK